MLIDHMAKGLSFESFSAIISVNQDTLHEWAKQHQIFSEAKKEAFAKNILFWEQCGIDGLYSITEYDEKTGKPTISKTLNASVWIFNMKNRHKWRDKQPGEEEKVSVVVNNLNQKTDAELDTIINDLEKRSIKK